MAITFMFSTTIRRPPAEVFGFLADVQRQATTGVSPARAMEKTPAGPTGVGTCWREVVQVLPFLSMTVRSTVTAIEKDRRLEMDFDGPAMHGTVAYSLNPSREGTRLQQDEVVDVLRPLEGLVARLLGPRLRSRLDAIRGVLEARGKG